MSRSDLDIRPLGEGTFVVDRHGATVTLRIRQGTGRREGYLTVKVQQYGRRWAMIGGQRTTEDTYRGAGLDLLRQIAEDPEAALIRYGRLSKRCGRCGRPLELEESQRRGIGPECLRKETR